MIHWGSEEVREAIQGSAPVVALETAVLTHGLPFPNNIQVLSEMVQAVRNERAVPAVIAVMEGRLTVGLPASRWESLAQDPQVRKASARDLAVFMNQKCSAGTTVAATLAACRLAKIRVFATGGMGGVHRDWQDHRDISADLIELSRTPCCLVSSGVKSILDVGATLEALETNGIPVWVYQSDFFPQFHSRGDASLPAPYRVDKVKEVTESCRLHWMELQNQSGILLANPIAKEAAILHHELHQTIDKAHQKALAQRIRGPALTPFLLAELASLTDGKSLAANMALLKSNAALAGRIAVHWSRSQERSEIDAKPKN